MMVTFHPIFWRRTWSLLLFFSFFFSFLFRTAPTEYGGSQAGGPIRAVAAGLQTATAMQDPSCICDLHHSSQKCQILNPLSGARDQTCVLMNASQLCFCWATMGTPGIKAVDKLCNLLIIHLLMAKEGFEPLVSPAWDSAFSHRTALPS